MRTELGKWLMDIAKYMVTVLLLSSVFGDMTNLWAVTSAILASLLTLLMGLWLVRNRNKRKTNSMVTIVVSVFVVLIGAVGVIYFNYQDKKEARRMK